MTLSQSLPQAARVLTAGLHDLHHAVMSSIAEHCGRHDPARFSGAWGHQVQHQAAESSGMQRRNYRTLDKADHISDTGVRGTTYHACSSVVPVSHSWQGAMHLQQAANFSSLSLPAFPEDTYNASLSAYMQPHQSSHVHRHSATRARVLDGKAVAAEWSAELEKQVPSLTAALGRPPGLAVVLVGCRPDSVLYVSRKEEACQRIGINCQILHLPDTISQSDLQEAVRQVAADVAVDGVLVQLPLPRHLDEERVMEFLDPRKDVDGFHPLNMG